MNLIASLGVLAAALFAVAYGGHGWHGGESYIVKSVGHGGGGWWPSHGWESHGWKPKKSYVITKKTVYVHGHHGLFSRLKKHRSGWDDGWW